LFFYGFFKLTYIWIIAASAVGNYILAGFIADKKRTPLYFVGIAANLAVLGYYKYADFLIGTLNETSGTDFKYLHIVLPLALSFVTFEQIAFLSDVRSGRVPRGSIVEYCGFIAMFPKLIAGPIIRYTEVLPQIRESFAKGGEVFTGLCIFSFGLFNKVVFADSLSPISDKVYAAAGEGLVAGSDAVLGTIAYSARIYFDFSAYSTMALGLAWMFGIRLPINFLSPYRSLSITDFWRRWHITLSRFLRDYLYIPLGGNRYGETRRYINLMLVMLLGGLWHGAGWAFVAWGAIHGVALALNHGWRKLAPRNLQKVVGLPFVAWLLTTAVVTIAWVFFSAGSFPNSFETARNIFASIGHDADPLITSHNIVVIFVAWGVALFAPNAATIFQYGFLGKEKDWDRMPPIPTPSLALSLVSAMALAIALIFVVSGTPNAFIYFQF
jgi:D-alanyl-lipoteichoic acid acyltransferase DltB (MBOAT superfamily)